MLDFSRANRGPLARWWWTVDHWVLLSLILLISTGVLLILAASPAVADSHAWTSFYFVKRHLILLVPSLALIVGTSLLTPKQIRRTALAIFFVSFILLVVTLFYGAEIKGARRWINLAGFSLQPSEFIKPGLAVLCGWMFAEPKKQLHFPGSFIAFILYASVVFLFLMQPDLGMTALISFVWFSQLFLAGISGLWIGILSMLGASGLALAYYIFPHVNRRIHLFLNPGSGDRFGDQFQVLQSLEAFAHGGLWGQGPGEGTVKRYLPDAHADFIFAVAGEEFGFLFCLFILFLYSIIVFRCVLYLLKEQDLFIVFSAAGLTIQFGIQALINMASTLNLIPPKGMTLPFISYGGSSLLALSLGMGMLLGLTRRRVEGEKN